MAPARRAVLAIVTAGAGGLCACTLLVGVPDNLTATSSGDAASEVSAVDATRDGTPPSDSGPRGDTATDAHGDAHADTGGADVVEEDAGPYPAGSWCAMQSPQGLVLCDDFDHDTLAFARWTTQDFGVLGSSGFSPNYVSAPYSLDIHVPPHMASNFFLEIVEKDVPGSPAAASVTLDYQFQSVSWPDAGSGQLYTAALAQGPGSPRVAVSVFTGPTGTELQEQDTDSTGMDTFNTGMSTFVPPVGSFSHLAVAVQFGGTPTATLTNAGTTLITLPLKGNWQAGTNTAVFIGDWYVTTTPGFEILYDDVTIRQQ